MGKQKRVKIPITFLHSSSSETLDPPLLPFLLVLPPPIILLPVLLSCENHPEARRSPGWLTPEHSPCSSYAGNNLSLLKEPKLLEGSTHLLLLLLFSPSLHGRHQAFSHAAAAPCASTCRLLTLPKPPPCSYLLTRPSSAAPIQPADVQHS